MSHQVSPPLVWPELHDVLHLLLGASLDGRQLLRRGLVEEAEHAPLVVSQVLLIDVVILERRENKSQDFVRFHA